MRKACFKLHNLWTVKKTCWVIEIRDCKESTEEIESPRYFFFWKLVLFRQIIGAHLKMAYFWRFISFKCTYANLNILKLWYNLLWLRTIELFNSRWGLSFCEVLLEFLKSLWYRIFLERRERRSKLHATCIESEL